MNFKYITFALFSILLLSVRASEEFTYDDGVVVLTEKNFEAALNKFEFLLVEFYAPWCGHCKTLAPEYSKAAKVLAKADTPVTLAKVDATQEKDLAERYEVEGFPTLKFFVAQSPLDYTGGRTEAEIVSWCLKKTGPISVEVKTEDQIKKLQEEHSALVVLFQKDSLQKNVEIFNKVAHHFEEVGFAYTSTPSLLEAYANGKDQNVVVFKQFDEKQVEFTQELTEENLVAFVEANELPTIMDFNQRAAEKIFGDNNVALVLLYKKDDDASANAQKILSEVAPQVKSHLYLTQAVYNEDLGERLAEYIGISDKDVPAFRILEPSNDEVKKYYFEGQLTAERLVKFVEDYKGNKLHPVFKSEEIPESNDEPVKIIVGKTWDKIVRDETKDVLVEFYAPWCGHCKSLQPIYDELATKLEDNKNIVIAKIDATANEIDGQPIQGFPTIKFYPSNNKDGVDYDGDRTVKGFLEFLEKHTTFEWNQSAKVDL